MTHADLVIVGAGPAAMSAAALVAGQGASVVMLDEQPSPGGQIYRNISGLSDEKIAFLGPDFFAGRRLVAGLKSPNLEVQCNAVVWDVRPDGRVTYSRDGSASQVRGAFVLLATGAQERAVPVPGWTLPGVMTAGAAQILMKRPGLVATDAIIAGSGPLIYLLATQMIAAGHPPKALVETCGSSDVLKALRHLPPALRNWRTLVKGAGLLRKISAAGVPRYRGATALRVTGKDMATGLAFHCKGRGHEIAAGTVLLHQGVVPNTQITRALRLPHTWDQRQRCFRPELSDWGQTANERVFVAGDGAGIAGAVAAEHAGRVAGAEILHLLEKVSRSERDRISAGDRRALAREKALRPFLDTAFPPAPDCLLPDDEVIVCRCEAVTAGDIRRFARLGCIGPNQAKAFGRAGMGPCQGRTCGLTVTEILAAEHGLPQDDVGSFRIRAPLKPVTLGELARLDDRAEP